MGCMRLKGDELPRITDLGLCEIFLFPVVKCKMISSELVVISETNVARDVVQLRPVVWAATEYRVCGGISSNVATTTHPAAARYNA